MPNSDGIRSDDWEQYVVSVDEIEAFTGYEFLSDLDDTVDEEIEK